MITVITPTTGRDSLMLSIQSLKAQTANVNIRHIILWDNTRHGDFLFPEKNNLSVRSPYDLEVEEGNYSCNCIVINGNFVQGKAAGSSLRAIGLMAADTEWVTFMDDDVMWDSTHIETMIKHTDSANWVCSKRRIWTISNDEYECLGVDDFESVGEIAKTPYKMFDNNCMMFKREFGVSASPLYRNTNEYNDDRLMYSFLTKYAGKYNFTDVATVNQVCPEILIDFFRKNCTKEEDNG